jgi:anti-sigma B factor antagonist
MVTCIAEAAAAEQAAAAAPDAPKSVVPLKLTHQAHSAGEAIVDLRGELDIATAAMAISYVSDVIDNHHGPVTVDLTALAFCDAQGLAALVRIANHAKNKGRPFQVASPRASLVKIMRITGLDRRFLTPKR